MEQFDIDTLFSGSTLSPWTSFDQQDANFLSGSRQILEPIIEETSEDEESSIQSYSSYTQQYQHGNYENGSQLSSESETGSVIRIEVHNDQDSISERDLACPAKRARRDIEQAAINQTQQQQQQHQQPQNNLQFTNLDSPRIIRKFQRNDLHNSDGDYLTPFNVTYRKPRFDEQLLYSDSDSQSYNSLSRSSSLIQFESLERQMQSDILSSGSSPSLLSFSEDSQQQQPTLLNRGSNGSLKRFESSDGRLHQTYLDLDKIDFTKNTNLIFSSGSKNSLTNFSEPTESLGTWTKRQNDFELPRNELRAISEERRSCSEERRSSKSDTESSSDTSILSHEERILALPKQPLTHIRQGSFRSKSSVENLSEDSGYCEHYNSQLKIKSKSISNILITEKFSEEDENYNKSLENLYLKKMKYSCPKIELNSIDDNSEGQRRKLHSMIMPEEVYQVNNENENLKIEQKNIKTNKWFNGQVKNKHEFSSSFNQSSSSDDDNSLETAPRAQTNKQNRKNFNSNLNVSNSLPDIREEYGSNENFNENTINKITLKQNNNQFHDLTQTISLPNNLNENFDDFSKTINLSNDLIETNDNYMNWNHNNKQERDIEKENEENFYSENRILAKKRNTNKLKIISKEIKRNSFDLDILDTFSTNCNTFQKSASSGLNYASYNNLTLLDYSGSATSITRNLKMSKQIKRNSFESDRYSNELDSNRDSREFQLGRGNFLLDEISAHFDKNVSILNDRSEDTDISDDFVKEESKLRSKQSAPKPPERRSANLENFDLSEIPENSIKRPPRRQNAAQTKIVHRTFDIDPTNLKTSYAESLERCNFDPKEISTQNLLETINKEPAITIGRFSKRSALKRNLVSSTPNLNEYQQKIHENSDENELQIQSACTSMQQLPQDKKLGSILVQEKIEPDCIVSKQSLTKSVNFYPLVAEYTWHEKSSEENDVFEPDSLENLCSKNTKQNELNNFGDVTDFHKSNTMNNDITNDQQQQNDRVEKKSENEMKATNIVAISHQQIEREREATSVPAQNKNNLCSTRIVDDRKAKETSSNILLSVDERRKVNSGTVKDNCKKQEYNKMIESQQFDETDNKLNIKEITNNLINNEKLMQTNKKQNKINLNNNLNDNTKMNLNQQQQQTKNIMLNTTVPLNPANNSELLNQKFKSHTIQTTTNKLPKSPEEKQHKSFLSRFANGFRFSLRRKSSPTGNSSKSKNSEQNEKISKNKKKSIADGASKGKQQNSNNKNAQDIIFIPLKGSAGAKVQNRPQHQNDVNNQQNNLNNNQLHVHEQNDQEQQINNQKDKQQQQQQQQKNIILRGKPPLPKQPPRVVGMSEKIIQQQQQQRAGQHAQLNQNNISNNNHIEINKKFLDNENLYYLNNNHDYNQFNDINRNVNISNMMNNNSTPIKRYIDDKYYDNINSGKVPPPPPEFDDYHSNKKNLNNSNKIGLIETNLDTHETIITGKTQSLMELGPTGTGSNKRVLKNKQKNILVNKNINDDDEDDGKDCNSGIKTTIIIQSRRPHKSMEFLLDKENHEKILPPENELQKSHDSTAALSEHQLRVQASLQRLNIPDWYRNYNQNKQDSTNNTSTGYKPGNFTRKRTSDSGRWTGLNSKTTSLSSLGSHRSDRSPLLLSPSAHSHHGTTIAGNVTGLPPSGGFSRWSTSYLNSTQTSPSASQRGSFSRGGPVNSSFSSVGGNQSTIRNSFRQPYMGWRSQEKINQPRTPHERLASSMLTSKPPKPEHSVTPEIQTSIKEVTSAIVHHFNDANRASARSRSTSPNSRKCWLESSFVGVRPVESPQTPTLDNSFTTSPTAQQQQQQQLPYNNHHYQTYPSDILRLNGVVSPLTSLSIAQQQRSPSSASLEDVLASLLGLPSNDSYRSTSGGTANEMVMIRVSQETQNSNKVSQPITTAISNLKVDQQNRFRRCSEGDAQQRQKQQENQKQQQHDQPQQHQQQDQYRKQNSQQSSEQQISRRVSLDSSDTKQTPELLIKCRNTKCEQTTNPIDAKKYFKSCHNCTFLYCSRECRRLHWEKHRKACLHSRVSNLCRQVLSACKDDLDTLRHLSLLARKGYLSQGRGVVRILFRSPENAENFIKNGFQCLGESSFVRWPDLMPAEMGLELYSELLRLSTEYKPESKMLIYVAICVVSEAPAAPGASVKWERQLVSRCAKLKLCKSILTELSTDQQLQQQLHDTAMEILILTFNSQQKTTQSQREIILQNILCILNRRGVTLKKHYPEIYQRLQTFADGQTERFIPVTLHPRDSQTGQGFVCIIMPTHNENELIKLPASEGGNKVCTIDVGEEMLES